MGVHNHWLKQAQKEKRNNTNHKKGTEKKGGGGQTKKRGGKGGGGEKNIPMSKNPRKKRKTKRYNKGLLATTRHLGGRVSGVYTRKSQNKKWRSGKGQKKRVDQKKQGKNKRRVNK